MSGRYGRKRKKWSARRWRFELTRIAVLLVFLCLVVGIVFGCRAIVRAVSGAHRESLPAEGDELLEEPEDGSGMENPSEPDPQQLRESPESTQSEGENVQEISIVMVGDVMFQTALQESGLQEDGTYNYDHFFAHTKDLISSADLAIVNQEAILGGQELGLSDYPCYNAPYEVGDALVSAGFNVICHANNHAADKGEAGITNCLNFWRTNYPDIHVLGIHDSAADQSQLCLIDVDGVTIAVLNYTYGVNGDYMPQEYSIDLLEEERVRRDLFQARSVADFVIVVPHWGTEYTHEVSQEQRDWAQLFLEYDVDLVIGAHPHAIQPVELLEGEDGHQMLVYYSLGNYITFTTTTADGVRSRAVSAMAQVTLTVENGQVSISDYGVVPLVSHMVEGTGRPTVYPLSEYTQELAQENTMTQRDPNFSLDYCRQLCRDVFGDLYQE